MILTTIQDALYDWMDAQTTWEIVHAEQNAPAPDTPYLTMRTTNIPKVGQDDRTSPNDSGIANITGNRELTLEVQGYGAGAIQELINLASSLEKQSVRASLRANNIAFVRTEPIQNLTYLVETHMVERGILEVVFRVAEEQTDDVGIIKKVTGDYTYKDPAGETVLQDTYTVDGTGPPP